MKKKNKINMLIGACLVFMLLVPAMVQDNEREIKFKIAVLAKDYNKSYQDMYDYCYSSLSRGHECYLPKPKPQ